MSDRQRAEGGSNTCRGSILRGQGQRWLPHYSAAQPDTTKPDTTTRQTNATTSTARMQDNRAAFKAGDVIQSSCNSQSYDSSSSSSSRSYRLLSQIHNGPQSTVWRAVQCDNNAKVIAKVVSTSTPARQAAALRELGITQKVTTTTSPSAAAAAAAAAAADSVRDKHLVTLLDSALITKQQQQQQQQLQSPESNSISSFSHSSSSSSSSSGQHVQVDHDPITTSAPSDLSAVVLILEPLHHSLSWIIQYLKTKYRQRALAPSAVRHLAHQLLTALHELHAGHDVVHRDVKPSNVMCRHRIKFNNIIQDMKDRSGSGQQKVVVNNMLQSELTAAQWTLVDFGSAARLKPPTAAAAAAAAAAAMARPADDTVTVTDISSSSSNRSSMEGWRGLFAWLTAAAASSSSGNAIAASSSSSSSFANAINNKADDRRYWQVASDDFGSPYETPAYTPPEALLHIPATAAYDIWSAACCIFEAATGSLLFPVEQAAAARGYYLSQTTTAAATAAAAGSSGDEGSSSSVTDVGYECDQIHLAMMKAVCGPVPVEFLQRSPVAHDLFADPYTGKLWIEKLEGGVELWQQQQQHDDIAGTTSNHGWSLWNIKLPWQQQQQQRSSQMLNCPLLHRLMATKCMSLNQAIELCEFLQHMLSWDPRDRPSAAQLLQHPYFKPLQLEQQHGKQ